MDTPGTQGSKGGRMARRGRHGGKGVGEEGRAATCGQHCAPTETVPGTRVSVYIGVAATCCRTLGHVLHPLSAFCSAAFAPLSRV
jgi:hypothetical protein